MKTERLTIIPVAVKKAPDYSRTAPELLALCREFYQDPENEKAFQEWKKARSGQNEKAV